MSYEMKGPLTIQDPFVDSTTYTVTVPKEYTAGCIGSHTLHAKSPDYVDDSDAFTNLLQVIDYSITACTQWIQSFIFVRI